MSVTTIRESTPRARREHRCSLCNRVIRIGETYDRDVNVWDGRIYTWKSCAHCRTAWLVASLREYAYEAEGMNDELVCEWEPQTIPEARWKVGWRRKWTRRDGSLMPVPVFGGAA